MELFKNEAPVSKSLDSFKFYSFNARRLSFSNQIPASTVQGSDSIVQRPTVASRVQEFGYAMQIWKSTHRSTDIFTDIFVFT